MELIICILLIIISFLIIYLFLLKKDLRRIKQEIIEYKSSNSNVLIHKEISMKELSEIIAEINLLIKENKETKTEFEKKSQDIKKMMTNISHDLKTPLTSALGYIDIILTSDLSKEEQDKELRIIENRLKRLEELISSFFEFSKIVSSDNKPKLTEVNIISILEMSVANYYEDFKNQNRKIIIHNKNQKFKILSNKEILNRIFDNLIGNAYKHSNDNLDIILEKNEKLKITFSNKLLSDTLDVSNIFNEFYTVDISRTKGNTGLGLAIVKEFVEQLNGEIIAQKEKHKLKLIIEFPFKPST